MPDEESGTVAPEYDCELVCAYATGKQAKHDNSARDSVEGRTGDRIAGASLGTVRDIAESPAGLDVPA